MNTIETVQQYFELSNKKDLHSIQELLMDDATYSSDNVGLHYGKEAIMEMKENFFGSFETLYWDVKEMKEVAPNVVEVSFLLTGKKKSGEEIEKEGIERVVAVDGKVRHVEVRNV